MRTMSPPMMRRGNRRASRGDNPRANLHDAAHHASHGRTPQSMPPQGRLLLRVSSSDLSFPFPFEISVPPRQSVRRQLRQLPPRRAQPIRRFRRRDGRGERHDAEAAVAGNADDAPSHDAARQPPYQLSASYL